jgi:hypothetical protein
MSKTSARVAPIDRAQIRAYAHSLHRRRVFDSWSDECLTYSWRVARDRRDLAARQ